MESCQSHYVEQPSLPRRQDKERENAAALEVLPDLLKDLDGTPPRARLTALIEGVLAANIFDWGAKACVDLYHNGTILEIYRRALRDLTPVARQRRSLYGDTGLKSELAVTKRGDSTGKGTREGGAPQDG